MECGGQLDDMETLPQRPPAAKKKNCVRCGKDAVLVVQTSAAFCRECFLNYFTHKFRSGLGKSRVVQPGEKVLLAFSGGPSSAALLHLVKRGMEEGTQKKRLRIEPGVVFIDEGSIIQGFDVDQRQRSVQTISKIAGESGFPVHHVMLEDITTVQATEADLPVSNCAGTSPATTEDVERQVKSLSTDDTSADRLKRLFEEAKSLTAKEDLLQILRSKLLVRVARTHGYTKVMVGDSGTRLSVRIMADIAQGRGAALPLNTGFADDRHGDVVIVRPMRDFIAKEISMYNTICQVESAFLPTLTTRVAEKASIGHLTEAFISGLQVNFPSTVSTVFRTGAKLCVSDTENRPEGYKRCAMCKAPLDTGQQGLLQSSVYKTSLAADDESDGGVVTGQDLCPSLCHGCSLTVADFGDFSTLSDSDQLFT
ncbi:cytoplasmic tRNA 2-thiolation protein 2-like [Branchiostoma floridae]|uniref:Cytoplasmic tRNA 2-thiolation protein 2 n=1 Tax=Branchiostoma floridae TaxID=7739 RepID=A0A9J7MGZ0_BRAFL|nr:cytoplasmic tRNA 2-thiolation protein 2-like [Branchiostoma floridae]